MEVLTAQGTEPRILRFVTSGDTERMRSTDQAVGHVGIQEPVAPTVGVAYTLHSRDNDSDASDADGFFLLRPRNGCKSSFRSY